MFVEIGGSLGKAWYSMTISDQRKGIPVEGATLNSGDTGGTASFPLKCSSLQLQPVV